MNIDEKTKISLFWVLASLPVLIGGILWLTSIDSNASAAQAQIQELRPMVNEILVKVIHIEEALKAQERLEHKSHTTE